MTDVEQRYAQWKARKAQESSAEDSVERRYQAWLEKKRKTTLSEIGGELQSRLTSWIDASNSYIESHNQRYQDRTGTYTDDYVDDSYQWMESVAARKKDLDHQADAIRSMLSDYGDYLDKDWVYSITQAMDESAFTQDKILRAAADDSRYWHHFDSADAYTAYQNFQQERTAVEQLETDVSQMKENLAVLRQLQHVRSEPFGVCSVGLRWIYSTTSV